MCGGYLCTDADATRVHDTCFIPSQLSRLEDEVDVERAQLLTSQAEAEQASDTLKSFRARRDEDVSELSAALRNERNVRATLTLWVVCPRYQA